MSDDRSAFWGDPPNDVDNPEWAVQKISPTGIVVKYQEKYGSEKEVECIGLWYSQKAQQYMLTWKDSKKIYLSKENIVSVSAEDKKQ